MPGNVMTKLAILFAGGFALTAMTGCAGSSPSLTAVTQPARPSVNPAVLISASHLSPGSDYLIGINTIWSPEFAARVHTDLTGSIPPLTVSFKCPYINAPPLNVGLFLQDGIAVARTTTAAPSCNTGAHMVQTGGPDRPQSNGVPPAARG